MKRQAFLAAALLLASGALAEPYKVGAIEVDTPWTRATPKGATIAGGYMTVKNTGTEPDRLVGGSAENAAELQLHEMKMEQGVMKMRELKGGLEIKPGETVELKPGGLHVMFVGLKQPLRQGDRLKASLKFERAGAITVDYAVEAIGAKEPAHGGHKH